MDNVFEKIIAILAVLLMISICFGMITSTLLDVWRLLFAENNIKSCGQLFVKKSLLHTLNKEKKRYNKKT